MVDDILNKYLDLPEYWDEYRRYRENAPRSCHHTNGEEKRVCCKDCIEELQSYNEAM